MDGTRPPGKHLISDLVNGVTASGAPVVAIHGEGKALAVLARWDRVPEGTTTAQELLAGGRESVEVFSDQLASV